MPDYKNGKIYKITNTVNDKIYIGSTALRLAQIMASHKFFAKTSSTKIFKAMRRHGFENFSIVLIKSVACSSKSELENAKNTIIKKYIDKEIVLYNTMTETGQHSIGTIKRMQKKIRGSANPNYGKVGSLSAIFRRGCVRYDQRYNSMVFSWRENGRLRSKSLSLRKYGEEEAMRLIEEYRDKIYPLE